MKSIRAQLPKALVLALLTSSLLVFASPSVAQGVPFVATGSLSVARNQQEATLLGTGEVLISGGQGPNGTTNPELYDPATGTFGPTGKVVSLRLYGTVTLLNNGQVLFAGGFDQSLAGGTDILATAELYDPATGTFTATGSMTTPRVQQTATLLNNGQVLIAGGWNYSGGPLGEVGLKSAELYDPATGMFTAAGNMTVGRYGAAATLINNGEVLITAGASYSASNTPVNSAELYDPVAGTFTATGNMVVPRYEHIAILLKNGSVLVTGGDSGTEASELYDPSTGTFIATGIMNTPRVQFAATLLNDGNVLVTGGNSSTLTAYLNTAELYDPATGTFTQSGCAYDPVSMTYSPGCMTVARYYQSETLLTTGKVLVAGGEGPPIGGSLASAELYDLPAVSVSPAAIDFGNEATGFTTASQNLTLTNNLPTTVNISSIATTGTNSGDFSQSNNCGRSVTSGSSCAVGVTFTPAAVGSRNAAITITDDALGSPQTASLSGTGTVPAPTASLSSTALTFTDQMVNSTSPSGQVTLSNTGTAPLTITSVAVTGANSGDFAQTNTCGSQVATGSSCTIGVNFTPTAVGTRTASVTITDSASDSPESVSLTGNGVAPTALLSGTTASFGSVPLGSSGGPFQLELINTGTATLTITSISITGANSGDFTQTNNCGTSLAASGGNCAISLTFTPLAAGARTATLTIIDNASSSPQTSVLTGNGLGPVAGASPTSVTFPNQYVGTSGLPQTVTLTNTGAGLLTITSVAASPADFAPLSACGSSLSAGSSCSIGVFFDPAAGGTRTGTLTITDNSMGSPQTVSLTGTGQDFSVATSSAATVTISPGQTASYGLSVAPNGGFNQSVSFTCSGAPAQSMCSVSPNPVPMNGSATAAVNVTVSTVSASLFLRPIPVGGPPRGVSYLFALAGAEIFGLALLAIWLVGLRTNWHPRLVYGLSLLCLLSLVMTITACGNTSSGGGSGSQGTPAGTYPLVVSGTFSSGSATLTHITNLTVKIQ